MSHEKLRLNVVSPQLIEIMNKILITEIDNDVKIAALRFLKIYVMHINQDEAIELLTYDENVNFDNLDDQ